MYTNMRHFHPSKIHLWVQGKQSSKAASTKALVTVRSECIWTEVTTYCFPIQRQTAGTLWTCHWDHSAVKTLKCKTLFISEVETHNSKIKKEHLCWWGLVGTLEVQLLQTSSGCVGRESPLDGHSMLLIFPVFAERQL